MEKRIWDDFLTERDKAVYAAAGYGRRAGFGKRPALMIIDVQNNFIGDKPEPILESIKKYRTSCGEEGWQAVAKIQVLLKMFRERKLPVIYTVSERRQDFFDSGIQRFKNYRSTEATTVEGTEATQIVAAIAPEPQDIVLSKRKPSAFFGTILMSHLNMLDVDTLIITGCSTSGCVRNTTVDSYAYNFHTIVVEEAVFDRGQASHAINLFDLNSKYADVVHFKEAVDYLNNLGLRDKQVSANG